MAVGKVSLTVALAQEIFRMRDSFGFLGPDYPLRRNVFPYSLIFPGVERETRCPGDCKARQKCGKTFDIHMIMFFVKNPYLPQFPAVDKGLMCMCDFS